MRVLAGFLGGLLGIAGKCNGEVDTFVIQSVAEGGCHGAGPVSASVRHAQASSKRLGASV
jgi:hypothetical protein